MKDRVGQGERQHENCRPARAPEKSEHADSCQSKDNAAERRRRPGINEGLQQPHCQPPRRGIPIHHVDAAEILAALRRQRRSIRRKPSTGEDQRHQPQHDANRKRHGAAEQGASRPSARALQQHDDQQRQRHDRGLRPKSDRHRRQECAKHDHPARCFDRFGRARRIDTLPHVRGRERGQGGQGDGQARHIAHGSKRVEPVQRTGDGENRGQRPRRRSPGFRLRRIELLYVPEERHQRKNRERAEDGAENGERLRVRRDDGARNFSKRHEDGIAGWMRLVLRRIELVQAEREIQRVDVFERRGQTREMRREEERRQGGGPEKFRLQTCRSSRPSFKLPVR